jgi:eukaryotic-like serine/threonine-protein kinase
VAVDWLPEPGEILDERYSLGDQIGVGPTGAVYTATRIADGKQVVLKVFHPELFEGQVRGPNTMRLQRARLMRAPGLITLEEIDVREGSAFVVMPHIGSETLPAWVETNGPPSLERVVQLVQTLGTTLETIHQLGVHGDVKPSNIYVSAEGDVLLSDPWFLEGLAGIRDAAGLAPRADAWLSPEQSTGTWQERPETDIYRLAMLMGWLLHGEVVEAGRSLIEQGVSVPQGLDAVFLRATQTDPGERFGQVQGFLKELAAVDWTGEAGSDEAQEVEKPEEREEEFDDSTTASDVQAPLDADATMTQGAEVLTGYPPVTLSEQPADEAAVSQTEETTEPEDAPDGEPELEDDPGATRVLRHDSSASELPEVETTESSPPMEQVEEASQEEGANEAEAAVEHGIGRSLDGLASEEAESEEPPDVVQEELEGPQRYETLRDAPGASGELEVAQEVGTYQEENAPEEEGLSSTRKQVAPELDPSWRTNPIMLIGPAMLLLSLFVAVSVLGTVQERRQAAAMVSADPVSAGKMQTPEAQKASQPVHTQPLKLAPVVPKAAAKVTETKGVEGEASGASLPAGEKPGPGEVERPTGESIKPGDAQLDGEPAGYRSLKCPPNMIRVRRAKKARRGEKSGEMEVWCIDRYEYPGKGRTPRTGIGVVKAERLCAERGHRLCTRREWGVACGGKYPYKGEFDPDACNSAAPGPTPRSVKPSGSKLRCVSGWGAYDMVGNVAEWTSEGKVNGGGARGDAEGGTCYRSIPRKSGGSDVGFRCCAEPSRTESPK